ncbi:Na+/H+ antiporter NhaA [Phytobacter sp. V91]|uniref:Na+/H+ antiporter NhaA n=1 Tax=Phytobacter sp. V91 TaxID=3369425 RepID=UPI003F5FEE7E
MKLFYRFINSEVSGGIILIIAAVLAMLAANLGATQDAYAAFLHMPVVIQFGALEINKNMLLWINDALMAVFFLMVGLEVKYELIKGSLATRQQAIFPVIAALGGMVAPALIYLLFNFHDPLARHGWAIPTATDIAFALGVLALLGNRVPLALKIFLMALAIIDDLGAIIIIALFYTSEISQTALGVATASIVLLALLNICNVRRIGLYIAVGLVLWTAVLKSGIHATLAGVIVGFLVPLDEQKGTSPARQLVTAIHPWVTWLILPLFAFANAGVSLQGMSLAGLGSVLPLGIIMGLFIGKPVGITLFCWLALRLKLAKLPQGAEFKQIMAVGVLCGIGFTMSIFISSLAFGDAHEDMVAWSKLGILTGSITSAVVGYCLLRSKLALR